MSLWAPAGWAVRVVSSLTYRRGRLKPMRSLRSARTAFTERAPRLMATPLCANDAGQAGAAAYFGA
jgi:hypothetical protein